MGAESRARAERRAKPEVIHRDKLFGGQTTAEELHRAVGIRKRCVYCNQPAAIRIKVFTPLDELTEKCPEYVAAIMATNPAGPAVPTTPMRFTPNGKVYEMVKVSDVGACSTCGPEAERAAARGPGANMPRGLQLLVEIDRGPGSEKPQVAVPR